MKGFCMEEEILKIYDNLYNVIGVASRSEVHAKGLLHQVVHLWMMEEKEGEKWLYFRQRSRHRKDFPGLYDLISSGHIDPEETFEEAIIENTAEKLGEIYRRRSALGFFGAVGNFPAIAARDERVHFIFHIIYIFVADTHILEYIVHLSYAEFFGTAQTKPLLNGFPVFEFCYKDDRRPLVTA